MSAGVRRVGRGVADRGEILAWQLLIDQAEPTLARVPWRHVERARVRTPAERRPPSPEHTLHAHTRCREAASSGVREVATRGASMAASGRSSRSRARSPGGQHECFLISFHRGSTLSLSTERPLPIRTTRPRGDLCSPRCLLSSPQRKFSVSYTHLTLPTKPFV